MSFKNIFLISIALFSIETYAQSISPVYGEIGYTALKYTETGATYIATVKPSIGRFIIGRDVNENLALEGMLALGISSGSTTLSGVNVSLKVNNSYGFYLKPKMNLGDSVEIFARVGAARSNITASASSATYSNSQSGSDFSFGGGVKFNISKSMNINFDYLSYYSKNDTSVKGYTVGVGFQF